MEIITSHQNARIKHLVRLHKAAERKKEHLFLIEGFKETQLALKAGFRLHSYFYSPLLDKTEQYALIQKKIDAISGFEITDELFSKVAYRDDRDGFIAVAHQNILTLASIKLSKTPLVLIIEAVEKPGNLGAILRTADAANVDAVIICDTKTDFYNPNVIRSSVGCLFTVQIAAASNNEVLEWLKINRITAYAAALTKKAKPYFEMNFKQSTAILFGTEATGLSDFWLINSDEQIIIPMNGANDSLNVSAATAIITFEAVRQRLNA